MTRAMVAAGSADLQAVGMVTLRAVQAVALRAVQAADLQAVQGQAFEPMAALRPVAVRAQLSATTGACVSPPARAGPRRSARCSAGSGAVNRDTATVAMIDANAPNDAAEYGFVA